MISLTMTEPETGCSTASKPSKNIRSPAYAGAQAPSAIKTSARFMNAFLAESGALYSAARARGGQWRGERGMGTHGKQSMREHAQRGNQSPAGF
jgi:hypothetical protein